MSNANVRSEDADVECVSGRVAKHPLVRKPVLTDCPFSP